jgi:hypothetical protein
MSLICPICDTKTSMNPVKIEDNYAFFPTASTPTHPVYGKALCSATTDDSGPSYTKFSIVDCTDCNGRFVVKKRLGKDSEWVPVYPITHKVVSKEVPEPIKSNFEEANLCYSVGAYRASLAMCQASLEALWRSKNVGNLKELMESGIISKTLFGQSDEIRRWANIAKHQPIADVIEKEDVEQLMAYLDSILDHVFVQPAKFDALKKKRETKEGK